MDWRLWFIKCDVEGVEIVRVIKVVVGVWIR